MPPACIRTTFMEAMDSYKDFIDEYIAFMENDGASNAVRYAQFMLQYAETMEKLGRSMKAPRPTKSMSAMSKSWGGSTPSWPRPV